MSLEFTAVFIISKYLKQASFLNLQATSEVLIISWRYYIEIESFIFESP